MPSPIIQLHALLAPGRIVDLKASTKAEALRELVDLMATDPKVSSPEALWDAVNKREELISTAIGVGIAIPHVKIPEINDYVIAIGRSAAGIEFDSLDGQPTRLIFMVGASDRQSREFVRMLARIMRLLKKEATRDALLAARMPDEFLEIIRKDDESEGAAAGAGG